MTDNDLMDERLRAYAERWRAVAPPVPAVDQDRLTSRHPMRRALWPAGLAAAAVAAGIVVGSLLIGHDVSTESAKPAHTATEGAVVPWAPLRATRPLIPADTISASPDPAEALDNPACRASDLRARTRMGPAGGTQYLSVRLVLAGERPCRLQGWPDLQFMDKGKRVDIPFVHQKDADSYHDPVLVAPGQPALLRLSWGSEWCTSPVHNDTIVLVLRNYLLSFPGFGGSPFCNGAPGSGPTPIRVEAFQPVTVGDPQVKSAYSQLKATGDLDIAGKLGMPADFTVALTSSRPIVLDPCPDYVITQSQPKTPPGVETFALNCAGVPYRDSDGRPYLPAHTSVQFAMRTIASVPGSSSLTWALNVPGGGDVGVVSGTMTAK